LKGILSISVSQDINKEGTVKILFKTAHWSIQITKSIDGVLIQ
tara:strand:+ start:465 stop:593 length:129 start_codon:yes stop_codon:yes gene_type:complete